MRRYVLAVVAACAAAAGGTGATAQGFSVRVAPIRTIQTDGQQFILPVRVLDVLSGVYPARGRDGVRSGPGRTPDAGDARAVSGAAAVEAAAVPLP